MKEKTKYQQNKLYGHGHSIQFSQTIDNIIFVNSCWNLWNTLSNENVNLSR